MTWRVAVWRRVWRRCFMKGGTFSCVWPNPTGTARRSPAAPCCCMPPPLGCAMHDNDHHHSQFACQNASRRQGAARCRRVPARPGHKCGAVDAWPNLAGDPRQGLPDLPQRPKVAPAAPPRASLTQPKGVTSRKQKVIPISPAVFRVIDRFHFPVSLARACRCSDDFRQEHLGSRIAVQDVVFATRVVIHQELDCDTGTIGPVRDRRGPAMAFHVAGIDWHRAGYNSPPRYSCLTRSSARRSAD